MDKEQGTRDKALGKTKRSEHNPKLLLFGQERKT
jgi:hypothetical protein